MRVVIDGAPAFDIVNIAQRVWRLSLELASSYSSVTHPQSTNLLELLDPLDEPCRTAEISERQLNRNRFQFSPDYRSPFGTENHAAFRGGRVPAYLTGCHQFYGQWVSEYARTYLRKTSSTFPVQSWNRRKLHGVARQETVP